MKTLIEAVFGGIIMGFLVAHFEMRGVPDVFVFWAGSLFTFIIFRRHIFNQQTQ